MPQYAFHLSRRVSPECDLGRAAGIDEASADGLTPVVIELADDARAVREAIAACGEWLRDVDLGGGRSGLDWPGGPGGPGGPDGPEERICGPWEMRVIDEAGRDLCTIHFVIRRPD